MGFNVLRHRHELFGLCEKARGMPGAGAPVPAQRACAMAGFALLAILLDRTALSLRLVAWSAVIVLAVAPESLTGASFQMSFAAVVALIAAWEAAAGWRRP